ncbi:NADPH-dependent FMN reductase [Gonapodya prolifera JEL478]|uniref:NADPH-dependent FMN reductase n=1 Tax=Gonapodya prolifera (strain JEL478) TaxID=1344416 RepID=A0A139AXR7_GONPJ|nr:NADPH-dependent FMN reductase [Gonapodya prolifera JEL478]|eukprot:KXS21497.1 NADPH-dependent FMN reductase [Gonapodya prolifera JEL478]
MSLNIVAVLGSVREGRVGGLIGEYVAKTLAGKGHTVTIVDPMKEEYKLPLLDKRVFDYADAKDIPPSVVRIQKLFQAADAYVLVTPEYNSNAAPALLNTLHHYFPEYNRKVAGIVTYSISGGGGRIAGAALRPVIAQLQMISTPNPLSWPNVTPSSFDASGVPKDPLSVKSVEAFTSELEWFGLAIKKAKDAEAAKI